MALYPAPDMRDGVIALWIAGDEPRGAPTSWWASLGFPVAARER